MAKAKDESSEITFKVLILGEQGVGKTCLLSRFMLNVPYERNTKSTVGVDIGDALLDVDGKKVKLLFWDTCGEESFGYIMKNTYTDTHAVLFVYDVCNVLSLIRVDKILRECDRYCGYKEYVKILVGNKIDQNWKRCIDYQRGLSYAVQNNMEYIESSAHNNIGISLILEKVATKTMATPVLLSNPWVDKSKNTNVSLSHHLKRQVKIQKNSKKKEVVNTNSTSNNISKGERIHNAHQIRQQTSSALSADVVDVFKISLLGESTVGKTSIIRCLSNKGFIKNLPATCGVGAEVITHELDDGRRFKLWIWDTVGQERFDAVITKVYRESLAVVFVYDVENLPSFKKIDVILKRCKERCINEEFVRVLVANKVDSEDRVVTRKQGEGYAKRHGMDYIEVSARLNDGICLILPKVIKGILSKPTLCSTHAHKSASAVPNSYPECNAQRARSDGIDLNNTNSLSRNRTDRNTANSVPHNRPNGNTGGSSCC